jgi:hypothetical protein
MAPACVARVAVCVNDGPQRLTRPRQPEIENLHAVRREKDVAGLEVTMNEALIVDDLKCGQRLEESPG